MEGNENINLHNLLETIAHQKNTFSTGLKSMNTALNYLLCVLIELSYTTYNFVFQIFL